MEEEIAILKEKIALLTSCCEFYADKKNWTYYDVHLWSPSQSSIKGDDTERLEGIFGQVGTKYYGGKLARETLRKLNEKA